MPFKDILVHVDDGTQCPSRLEVAVALATSFGAHLVGLHVRPILRIPGAIAPDYGGQIAILQSRYAADAAAKAKDLFETAVGPAGISHEWRDVTGDVLDTMALHARYVDFVVVGQADSEAGDLTGESRLADHLVLEAGTPVLVVPYVGEYPTIGEKVLIAWNGSREARRAVSDALPILAKAKLVTVLAINPGNGGMGHGDVPGADICLHLARHGVNAVCESIRAADLDVGNMLLSRAADEGSDLLVMGAYGHSRVRELVLGGATRHLLRHMTIPVLMSH